MARRLLALIADATRDYLLAQVRAGAQARAAVRFVGGRDVGRGLRDLRAAADRGAGRGAARDRRAGDLLRQRRRRDPRSRRARRRDRLRHRLARADRRGARAPGRRRRAVQGNLDPAVLLGPISEVERRARDIVRRGGKRGHIFNLGHGITPDAPIEAVEALVAAVRSA